METKKDVARTKDIGGIYNSENVVSICFSSYSHLQTYIWHYVKPICFIDDKKHGRRLKETLLNLKYCTEKYTWKQIKHIATQGQRCKTTTQTMSVLQFTQFLPSLGMHCRYSSSNTNFVVWINLLYRWQARYKIKIRLNLKYCTLR